MHSLAMETMIPLKKVLPYIQPGQSVIPSRITDVYNDFHPEEDECYTIGIFTTDIPGARELFSCNDDDMANNFSVFIPSALQMMMVDHR